MSTLRDRLAAVGDRLRRVVTLAAMARVLGTIAALAVPVGVLYLSWQLTGPLATVIYTMIFLLLFLLVPLTIGLFGSATPGSTALGKGHFILGAFAAGHWYLVQTPRRYRLCVGDGDRFYLDGEWHAIEGGRQNKTHLAWRPFGLVYLKADEQLQEARVKERALSDGGAHSVERAGIQEVSPAASIQVCPSCDFRTGDPDRLQCPHDDEVLIDPDPGDVSGWRVDLKRLYRTGLARVGNIDLLETSEEQTMRDEVGTGTVSEWSAVIGMLLGLIIGVVAGYIGMFA